MTRPVWVKIAMYKDEVVPMHFHDPYEYWQFPWEKHREDYHSSLKLPNWIWPEQTMSHKSPYEPTEEEIAWYNDCLRKKTPPPMTPEAAYNFMKIVGKLPEIKEINDNLKRISNPRGKWIPLRSFFEDASTYKDVMPLTALLAVQHVRTNHL